LSPRKYDLGRRQAAVERNRGAMLSAARDLLIAGGHPGVSVGAVAARAGVSRLTVYNRFGSKARLLRAVVEVARSSAAPAPVSDSVDPLDSLRRRITES